MSERLTMYVGNGEHYESINPIDTPNEYGKINLQRLVDRLAEYEDLDEQGLLLRLPCKVGDTLYVPYSRPKYIKEVKVTDFLFDGVDFHIRTDFVTFSLRNIGVDLFLTQSEAEENLRKYEK